MIKAFEQNCIYNYKFYSVDIDLLIFLLMRPRLYAVATRGKIIVIEGTDKAGKGSQSRMLAESLKTLGKICVILDFPDYTTQIGIEIKAFL